MDKKSKMVDSEAGLLLTIESIRDLQLTAKKLCQDAGLLQSHEEAILDYISAAEYDIGNALNLLSNGIKRRLKSERSTSQWDLSKSKFISKTCGIYSRARLLLMDISNEVSE